MNIDKIYLSHVYLTTFFEEYYVNGGYYFKRSEKFLKNAFIYYDENKEEYIDIFSGEYYCKSRYDTYTGEKYADPVFSLYTFYSLLYNDNKHDIPKRKVLKLANKVLTDLELMDLESKNNNDRSENNE